MTHRIAAFGYTFFISSVFSNIYNIVWVTFIGLLHCLPKILESQWVEEVNDYKLNFNM